MSEVDTRITPALHPQNVRNIESFADDDVRPFLAPVETAFSEAYEGQILIGVSQGKLDAETAKTLIGCIQSVAGIRAVEELEQRILILEARQVA